MQNTRTARGVVRGVVDQIDRSLLVQPGYKKPDALVRSVDRTVRKRVEGNRVEMWLGPVGVESWRKCLNKTRLGYVFTHP